MKKICKYLALALMLLMFSACGARSAIMAALPDDAAKEKAAELLEASPSDEVTADEIAEDLMLFRSVNTGVDNFVSFTVEDGKVIYCEQLTPEVQNRMAIEQSDDGSVVVDYWEDELHNVVEYKPNGDILLDGNKVEFK